MQTCNHDVAKVAIGSEFREQNRFKGAMYITYRRNIHCTGDNKQTRTLIFAIAEPKDLLCLQIQNKEKKTKKHWNWFGSPQMRESI